MHRQRPATPRAGMPLPLLRVAARLFRRNWRGIQIQHQIDLRHRSHRRRKCPGDAHRTCSIAASKVPENNVQHRLWEVCQRGRRNANSCCGILAACACNSVDIVLVRRKQPEACNARYWCSHAHDMTCCGERAREGEGVQGPRLQVHQAAKTHRTGLSARACALQCAPTPCSLHRQFLLQSVQHRRCFRGR